MSAGSELVKFWSHYRFVVALEIEENSSQMKLVSQNLLSNYFPNLQEEGKLMLAASPVFRDNFAATWRFSGPRVAAVIFVALQNEINFRPRQSCVSYLCGAGRTETNFQLHYRSARGEIWEENSGYARYRRKRSNRKINRILRLDEEYFEYRRVVDLFPSLLTSFLAFLRRHDENETRLCKGQSQF